MKVVIDANDAGVDADLDQILERINYKTTKASLHFSIRALVAHALIKKREGGELRRERKHTVIKPTILGVEAYRAQQPHYVTALTDDTEAIDLFE